MEAKGCFKPRPIKYIIDANGCHICTSHRCKNKGYPKITRDFKTQLMVRYLWEQKNGRLPENEGLLSCHKCDNPRCINTDHIFFGTQKENIEDMIKKGRNLKGERNPGAKLTDDLVRYIRNSNLSSDEKKTFCKENNITRTLFYLVKQGKKWKHIK